MKRNNIMMHALTCGFAQIYLMRYLAQELIFGNLDSLVQPAINIKLTISCLFCSLILHMALQDKL